MYHLCILLSPCDKLIKLIHISNYGVVSEGRLDCILFSKFYFQTSRSISELPISSTILSKNAPHATHLLHFLGPAVINDSQWKLCYRASLNGWDALTFHSLCDGKKNTVTIIESNQYVFGGYTGAPWGK